MTICFLLFLIIFRSFGNCVFCDLLCFFSTNKIFTYNIKQRHYNMPRKPMSEEQKNVLRERLKKARDTKKRLKEERENQGLANHDKLRASKPKRNKDLDNYNTQNDLERKINDVKQQLLEKERKKELRKLEKELQSQIQEEKEIELYEKEMIIETELAQLEKIAESIQSEESIVPCVNVVDKSKIEQDETKLEDTNETQNDKIDVQQIQTIEDIEEVLENQPLERSLKKERENAKNNWKKSKNHMMKRHLCSMTIPIVVFQELS